MMKNPYDLLHVARTASAADIKKSWISLAAEHHPDRNGSTPEANGRAAEINAAYEMLKTPEARQATEAMLDAQASTTAPTVSVPNPKPAMTPEQVEALFKSFSERLPKSFTEAAIRLTANRPPVETLIATGAGILLDYWLKPPAKPMPPRAPPFQAASKKPKARGR